MNFAVLPGALVWPWGWVTISGGCVGPTVVHRAAVEHHALRGDRALRVIGGMHPLQHGQRGAGAGAVPFRMLVVAQRDGGQHRAGDFLGEDEFHPLNYGVGRRADLGQPVSLIR